MLVYSATKQQFIDDVRANVISESIENEVARKLNRNSPRTEVRSWENSLRFMMSVLLDEGIPASAGVAIEYNIPLTNRRVDFILTGKDHQRNDAAVIVELKHPCAYLHNMKQADAINDRFYEDHTRRAPVFISKDAMRLSKFLSQHINYGDSNDIMYRIEHGVIKPSKNLADALASMMTGNDEFLMWNRKVRRGHQSTSTTDQS